MLLLVVVAHSAAAYGASTSANPGDPPAGSPAGGVYQLPFEKGRSDASPKGSGGTTAVEIGGTGGGGGEGGGGSSEGSLYRSENNFGSSSEVPGSSSATKGAGGGGAGGSGSGEGTGSGSDGAGTAPAGEGVNAARITDSGNTSPTENIALLGLIGLIAVAVGLFAARANRLRTQP